MRKIAENYKLPYYTISPTYSVCKNHGYLAGEQFTCPECGEHAEVYSRITGYYRPVQNWNDGKSQEYRERKTYDIAHSHLKHSGPIQAVVKASAEAAEPEQNSSETRLLLFATKTCPNCKIAASMLDKAGIPYEKVYVEDNEALAVSYDLRMAPTLIAVNGDTHEKYASVPNIKKFINDARVRS